jgi:hypothetical protein
MILIYAPGGRRCPDITAAYAIIMEINGDFSLKFR